MITNRKITTWEKPVSAEADRPQRTAAELKAVFDGNSEQLKSSVNGLIDDLTVSEGAENIGSPSLPGIVANGLWAQIAAFFAKVFGIVRTDQPSNRYLNGAGQYTVPAVGAAANGLPLGGNDNDFLLKNGEADFAMKWQAAAAVRSRLNVADGADNTGYATNAADEAGALTDTDAIPVYRGGLKKSNMQAVRASVLGGYADLSKPAVEREVKLSHGGSPAGMTINDIVGGERKMRIFFGQWSPNNRSLSIMGNDDRPRISLSHGVEPELGLDLNGIYISDANGEGVSVHANGLGNRSITMKGSYGDAIRIESLSTGGNITLKSASGVLGAEIIFDAVAGGQIKLYNADGTHKQTIG